MADIKQMRNCPKCGKNYGGVPALSRVDNKTLICPNCGVREALESIGVDDVHEQDHILRLVNDYSRRQKKNKVSLKGDEL